MAKPSAASLADAHGLVVINLGTAHRTPLNFLKNADKALSRGLADGNLEGGTSIAIALVLLACQTAQILGTWADPVQDIEAAFLQAKQTCLEIAKVARGRAAEINRGILSAADESLRLLGDGRAN